METGNLSTSYGTVNSTSLIHMYSDVYIVYCTLYTVHVHLYNIMGESENLRGKLELESASL